MEPNPMHITHHHHDGSVSEFWFESPHCATVDITPVGMRGIEVVIESLVLVHKYTDPEGAVLVTNRTIRACNVERMEVMRA